MSKPKVLLINPPMWNPFAPHLAVPLLAAATRAHGFDVASLDLGIETFDWLISSHGLSTLEERLRTSERSRPDDFDAERARLVYDAAVARIDQAKSILRDFKSLTQPEAYEQARLTVRNAMWCVGAAFPRLDLGFLAAESAVYSTRSTRDVLEASSSSDSAYNFVFELLLPSHLRDSSIGAVGISISADTQLVAAITAARIVKRLRPEVSIVLGGNYITRIAQRWTSRHPFFDLIEAIILSEGEESLSLWLNRIFQNDPGEIPGLVVARGDSLLREQTRAVVLDSNPTPDFDDFPLEKYFAPGPVLPLYASRSCSYPCSFCSIPFASNDYRSRSAKKIVDDMRELGRRHGSKHFMLVDELLTPRTLREVSGELIRRELNVFWYGETRFGSYWTEALAEQLYRSGCRRLSLGLESFNQRILNQMRKGTKVDDIGQNVETLLSAGVPIHLFAILGFPGETPEETVRTVDFIQDSVRRSRETYGVLHTTFGASEFILDLQSEIGRNPDRYGIEVEWPSPDEDLALSANYSTNDGINSARAAELAEDVGRGGSLTELAKTTTRFHQWRRPACEEEIFLRASVGAPPSRRPAYRVRILGPEFMQSRVWLSRDVYPFVTSARMRDRSASVMFYQAAMDMIYELRYEQWAAMPTGTQTIEVLALAQQWASPKGSMTTSVREVERLVRHHFLETDSLSVSLEEDSWENLTFYQESQIVESRHDGERGLELANRMTGRVAGLDVLGETVWEMLQDGFAGKTVSNGVLERSQEMKLKPILSALVENGFAFARRASSDDSRVAPSSLTYDWR